MALTVSMLLTSSPEKTHIPFLFGTRTRSINHPLQVYKSTPNTTKTILPKLIDSTGISILPSRFTEPFITPFDTDSDDEFDEINVLDEEEQVLKNPFLKEGSEYPSDLKEEDDALYARFDMPGIGKENIKLYVEMSTVHIKGEEGKIDPDYNNEVNGPRKYSTGIVLTPGRYKVDKIRAMMKDGILRVVIPKIKLEEKHGVFPVSVN